MSSSASSSRPINRYDGTTFIVRRLSNVKSVKDLDGATIRV